MIGNTMFPNMQMPGMGNSMMNSSGQNMNGINSNFMFANNNTPIQNLNNLYPSIYRIINPVAARVVSNNTQAISEDLLNNMTDTVFNIVEGQIDFGDDTVQRNHQAENPNSSNTLQTNSTNNTTSNSSTRTTESNRQTTSQTNFRNTRNDSILRDLIKIIIIKNLLSRNQMQRQYMFGTQMGYQPYF